MKALSGIPKKGIMAVSAVLIVVAGALVLGSPAIYGMNGGGDVGTASSYVNIPILNNHYPKTATISEMYFCAPVACSKSGMTWYNVKKVKEIRFGDTVVFTATSGNCCCSGSSYHTDGRTYDTVDYAFSSPKVLCRVTLDVESAPQGTYTIKYYYRIPGDTVDREQELTYTLP